GFTFDLLDHRIALHQFGVALRQQLLEKGGIIRQCGSRIHAPNKTHRWGKSCGRWHKKSKEFSSLIIAVPSPPATASIGRWRSPRPARRQREIGRSRAPA